MTVRVPTVAIRPLRLRIRTPLRQLIRRVMPCRVSVRPTHRRTPTRPRGQWRSAKRQLAKRQRPPRAGPPKIHAGYAHYPMRHARGPCRHGGAANSIPTAGCRSVTTPAPGRTEPTHTDSPAAEMPPLTENKTEQPAYAFPELRPEFQAEARAISLPSTILRLASPRRLLLRLALMESRLPTSWPRIGRRWRTSWPSRTGNATRRLPKREPRDLACDGPSITLPATDADGEAATEETRRLSLSRNIHAEAHSDLARDAKHLAVGSRGRVSR